ncbi:hypothetical protein BGZ49_005732 [Haplosporangium sp. Z 27]|nr:hypothetical protein BGZ49_005732 [Haplosporangium sp. Z 27]
MPDPQHEQPPTRQLSTLSQDDLPTADSLFGDNSSFLSQLPSKTIPARPVINAISNRPPNNNPPARPQHLPYNQHINQQPYQHAPPQFSPQRPPQNPTGRPLSPSQQSQQQSYHRQPQYRPQRPLMQQSQSQSQQFRPLPQSQQQQSQRPQHLHQRVQENMSVSPIQSSRALPLSPPQNRPTAYPAPRNEHTSPFSASQTQSKIQSNSTGFLNPLSAVAPDKDTLPSADVLFGSSSSFDLFSPTPPIPQKLPTLPQQNLQPTQPPVSNQEPLMQTPKQDHLELNEESAVSNTSSLFSSPFIPPAEGSTQQGQKKETILSSEPRNGSQLTDMKRDIIQDVAPQAGAPSHNTLQQVEEQNPQGEPFLPDSTKGPEFFSMDEKVQKMELEESSVQDPKPEEALNMDSSSLFAESADMDASQLFPGASSMDSNLFFTGLSRESQTTATKKQYISTPDTSTAYDATYPNHHFSAITSLPISNTQGKQKVELDISQEEDTSLTTNSFVASTESKQDLSLPWESAQPQDSLVPHFDHQDAVPENQKTTNQLPEQDSTEAHLHNIQHSSDRTEYPQETQLFTNPEPQPHRENQQVFQEHSESHQELFQEHSRDQLQSKQEHLQFPEHLQYYPETPNHFGHSQPHHQVHYESQSISHVYPESHLEHGHQHHDHHHHQSNYEQHQHDGFTQGISSHQEQDVITPISTANDISTRVHADQTLKDSSTHELEPLSEHLGNTQLISHHLQQPASTLPLEIFGSHETGPRNDFSDPFATIGLDQKGMDQTLSFRPPPQPQPQSLQLNDQPIQFDANPSGPASPVYDRESMSAFSTNEINEGGSTEQSGSYSILELSSELAQSPYFSQARQSPLIQEHFVNQESFLSSADTSQWKKHQMVAEESNFDQVSLTEDAASSPRGITSVSSPPRERGLASLLDPSTLSAVEDLLNMPKSAAFERGMSRLFKGVKSQASSMFASPLSQVQVKVSGSREVEKDDTSNIKTNPNDTAHELSGNENPEPSEAMTGNGVTSPDPSAPPPPPPSQSEGLDQSKIISQPSLPPSIPPPPMGPKRNSTSLVTAKSPKTKSPTQQPSYDWAHKQATPFAEVFDNIPQEVTTINYLKSPESPITQFREEQGPSVVGEATIEQIELESTLPKVESQETVTREVSDHQQETFKHQSDIVSPLNHSAPSTANSPKIEMHPPTQVQGQSTHPFFPNSKLEPSHGSPALQRPSSPSVLDREALLRKQAAVTALRADHGGAGAIRANNDKKAKLLEKARELLEKRQQQAGHLSPLLSHSLPSPLMSSRRSSSEVRSEQIKRAGSISSVGSSRVSLDLTSDQHQHEQRSRSPLFSSSYRSDADHHPAYPLMSVSRDIVATQQSQQSPDTSHVVSTENKQLKQQLEALRAEAESLKMNHVDAAQLRSQIEQEMREELSRVQTELEMSSTAFNESYIKHSQQLSDMAKENQRLQDELAHFHRLSRDQDQDRYSELTNKCQHLEMELEQSRRLYPEYQAALSELERLSNVNEENEHLRQQLQQTLQKVQDQTPEQSQQVISLEGEMLSPEQLSREAEGLRRQLKGQRDEMKLLQDNIKRSDNEKREFVSRIEHLERLLADAEKYRNELKSHQTMKDEAYKVIQERLVASFEEEKAQYIDEEAFKMVKLEHRYNLQQEELQAQLAESKIKQEEMEQAHLKAQRTILSLQERVKQLESELAAKHDLTIKHETRVAELEADIENSKKREEHLAASFASLEERMALLQDSVKAGGSHDDSQSSSENVESSKIAELSTKIESITKELNLSLGRESELEKRIEMVLQTTTHSAQSPSDGNHNEDLSFQQIEYDRLASQASRWQEECLMAQEEKMRVEDQLQRVEMELIAARTEINQLEVTLGAESGIQSSNGDQLRLEQELEEAKSQLQHLKKQLELSHGQNGSTETAFIEKEQILNDRLSDLAQQLEVQRSESIRLERELEEIKNGQVDSNARVVEETKVLETLLDEERRSKSQIANDLEKQLQRAKEMLMEKQKEVEQMTLDLDNMTYKSAAMERDLTLLQEYRNEAQKEKSSTESAAMLQSQLNELTTKHDAAVAEIAAKDVTLKEAISTLEATNRELEQQLRQQTDSAEKFKNEANTLQQSVLQLQNDLSTLTEKLNSEEETRGQTLQDEYNKTQGQLKLVADLFGKLLKTSEDPEELAAVETTVVSMLSEMKPLGVSIQTLPQVCVRLVELQRLEAGNRNKVHELEAELQTMRSSSLDSGRSPDNVNEFSEKNATDNDAEVQELRQKLIRTELGITKLQQFLQEFQNEKKMAINELQQRLLDSENDVSQARSQLAKAQAMLMAKSSDPATPTQGTFLLAPMSPTHSRSQSPSQQQLQQTQQQQESRKPSLDSSHTLLSDEMFESTEHIRHEAVLALEPLRLQKAELERTLLDLRHRYELSQKENDSLLSALEKENQQLRAKAERMSPDMSSEHLERIRELEIELIELTRQLKTAQREREFARQDMRAFKSELAKLKAQK